jgi:hypothetical protein
MCASRYPWVSFYQLDDSWLCNWWKWVIIQRTALPMIHKLGWLPWSCCELRPDSPRVAQLSLLASWTEPAHDFTFCLATKQFPSSSPGKVTPPADPAGDKKKQSNNLAIHTETRIIVPFPPAVVLLCFCGVQIHLRDIQADTTLYKRFYRFIIYYLLFFFFDELCT